MLDRSGFTADELATLEVAFPSGGGNTDPKNFEIWQQSFEPRDASVRQKKKIDIRDFKICGGKGVDL